MVELIVDEDVAIAVKTEIEWEVQSIGCSSRGVGTAEHTAKAIGSRGHNAMIVPIGNVEKVVVVESDSRRSIQCNGDIH